MRRLEKRFRRYIDKNWIYLLIALWLTSKAIDSAYEFRGYKAFGSEFLVLPVFLLIIEMLRKTIRFVRRNRENY